MTDVDCEAGSEPPIDRLRGQDAGAFAWLVARTQRIVFGIGQSVGLAGADADDAAADVYLAVYRALPTFAGSAAVTTWVYAIACRVMRRHRARRDRQRVASVDVLGHDVADPRMAADELEVSESREALWAAVESLEARSAMAVELFYRRGFTTTEVAAALDCPEGTVKTLLHRARLALREQLAKTRRDHEST